jgi:hypothetical protein
VSSAAITALAVDRQDPQSVWAAGSLGVLLSRTGGNAWTGVNAGLTVRPTTAVAVDPADGANVFVGTAGGGVFALRLGDVTCGDGITDAGEQCDRGADNGAVGSCCAIDCAFRLSGTLCRTSTGACDLAEACTGDSGGCPTDVFVDTGTPCDDGDACTDGDQCRDGACAAGPPLACGACQQCDSVVGCTGAICTVTPTPVDTATPEPSSTPEPSPTAGPACVGDCDGDGTVAINELIRGVGIALGSATLEVCPSLDTDNDGSVAINELVRAVNAALSAECGA